MRLESFLSKKPLYYKEIDYDRFPDIYNKIRGYFKLPRIIHIIGTNAKGSTGRALAYMLCKKGLHVGHYSSPHITSFNERIWFDGEDVDDEMLEMAHQKLQDIVCDEDSKALSYFEYTTLLAMLLFCDRAEIVLLEAGLGGEFDATQVFEKDFSIVTPIGYDHQALLGSTLKEIVTTKLRSVSGDLVLAKQYEKEVYKLAFAQTQSLGSSLYLAESFLSDELYSDIDKLVEDKKYPAFFKENFATAFCAYALLGYEPDVSLLEGFYIVGRVQKILPNVTIDVGHNSMAARALRDHFRGKKIVLIYNSYDDKEYSDILTILKPIIKEVEILKIESSREVSRELLESALDAHKIGYCAFEEIKEDEEYLVFGSFSVVQKFLEISR